MHATRTIICENTKCMGQILVRPTISWPIQPKMWVDHGLAGLPYQVPVVDVHLSLSLSLHKRRLFIATRQPAVSRSLYQVDEFIYRQVDSG